MTSSFVASRCRTHTRSVTEPSGTGTRRANPSSFPLSSGMARDVAFAAPVDAGTVLIAAARARRRSLCGRSSRFWSFVYACTVVMKPRSMPKASPRTFAIGTTQFVVHEAFETMLCVAGS